MKRKIMVFFLLFILSGCNIGEAPPEYIEDETAPNFYGIEDIELPFGARFDPLDAVKAYDVQDGYITSSIQVEGQVDVFEWGTYLIKYRVTDSDDNVTLSLRYVTITQGPLEEDNIFPYGTFDNQLQGFDIYVEQGTGDANFYTQDGVLVIDILNIESGKWYCPRLNSWGVTFEQGVQYRIEFDAKADQSRLLQIQVGELVNYEPWFFKFDPETKQFELTQTWETYEYQFTMLQETNNNVNVLFEMGDVSGDTTITKIYLDNLKIIEMK